MNGAQIYALFVSPFVVAAMCGFIYWFTGWQDRREDARAAAHRSSGSSPSNSMPNPDRPT